MRIFLIESGLVSLGGHHYMEARSFRRNAEKHGIETIILANNKVLNNIRDELNAIPLFPNRPYAKFSNDPICGPLEDFLHLGNQISSSLCSLGNKGPGSEDILVAPVAMQHELLGIANWLRTQNKNQRPYLALNFMIDNITCHGESQDKLLLDPQIIQLYRFGLKQIITLMPENKVLLTSGSSRFSAVMTKILSRKINTFPLPVCHEIDGDPISELDGDDPVIAYIGKSHPGKLPDLIPALIHEVWKSNPNARFLLQGNPAKLAEKWRAEFSDAINSGRIYVVSGEVDQATYNRLIISSDILFLPYNEKKYRIKTSGIFSEALALGKITIVPEGTWMSDILRQRDCGGVTFNEQSINSYSGSITSALNSFPSLKDKAKQHADVWKDKMGMKSFVDGILDFYNTGRKVKIIS